MPKRVLTIEDREKYQRAGRKGGLKTKERMLAANPNFYSEIGKKSGDQLLATRGKEYYAMISRKARSQESMETKRLRGQEGARGRWTGKSVLKGETV